MEDRIAKLEAYILRTESDGTNGLSKQPLLTQQVSHVDLKELPRDKLTGKSPHNSQVVTLNLSCSLGAFPASSMINFSLTDPRGTSIQDRDLISRRLIPPEAAEDLFSFYKHNMDPFAYDILTENDSLASISRRSSLLTAAICTVAAFWSDSAHYRVLNEYLKNEVSEKVFSNNHEFDDVRALCIGALWLNEISTALNSLGD